MKNTDVANKEKKVSYYRKPEDMTLDEWQVALRRQFAGKQNFDVKNIGDHPVYSDFLVYNPGTGKEYKVAIRDYEFGMNFCSCPDFKINGLGTCKHVEYVLKQLKENPQNEKYWENPHPRPYSSLSLKYGEERKVFLRVGTTHTGEMKALSRKYFDQAQFLQPEAFYLIGEFIEQAKNIDPDFRIYQDALDFIISTRSNNLRRQKMERLFPEESDSGYFNGLIKTDLYPYQKEGVLFAAKAGRSLMADDMGLGKTVQAIATVEILAREFGVAHVLVICPTSLKYQWRNEISKYSGRSIKVIEGHLDKRVHQYKSDEFYKIASYGVALNDIDYLNKAGFDMVILDEAQRIKNWKTKTAQNLKKLNTEYALVLTGTPLENKLEELHSIVEFIDPYRLGALFHFLDHHQIKDGTGKVIGYDNLNEIKDVLKDILIRRTKDEIIHQLPARIDKNYFVDVTKEQWDIHQDYDYTVSRLVHKWRKMGFLSEPDRKRLLISLSCMRMVCDSTYILDQKTRYDVKIDELVIQLKEILENGKDKVVVFSQWKRMTGLVAEELQKLDVGFEYLHGGVPGHKRNDLINNFKNDPDKRLFLSTDAGGVGLNLQSANVVINLDLPWNPAVLEQRIGRVHRLGQSKPVMVINYISKGTIEHKILGVIGFKKSVFEGVLDEGDDRVVLEDSRFGKFMKTIETIEDQSVTTHKEPEGMSEIEVSGSGGKTGMEEEKIQPGSGPLQRKETDTSKPPETATGGDAGVNELLTTGISFIEKLGGAISKIQTGEMKVSDFVEKNKETGETSFRIPVKDEETVAHAIKSLANIFTAFTNMK